MIVISGLNAFYYTVSFFLLIIGIKGIISWINNRQKEEDKRHEKENSKIPIGYYLIISNIISLIICNFLK